MLIVEEDFAQVMCLRIAQWMQENDLKAIDLKAMGEQFYLNISLDISLKYNHLALNSDSEGDFFPPLFNSMKGSLRYFYIPKSLC